MTDAEMADLYADAIRSLLEGGASSVSIAGRTHTMLDLGKLEEGRDKYLRRANRARGGLVSYGDLRAGSAGP
jgi:hypothetical protein